MSIPKPFAKRAYVCAIALFFSLIPTLSQAVGSTGWPTTPSGEPTLAPIVERALPAVVNISTVTHIEQEQHPLFQDPFFRRFFELPELPPQQRERNSLGSGVIIDADEGYVLTNHHVIARADEISVILQDGRRLEAKQVGVDPEADIAVLQIDADGLTELPLGDMETVDIGDLVIAIGNPFGLGHTVTSGIISALSRTGLGIEGYEDFIQTDASINPGNSGGALIDWQGRLVGINTAIVGPSGGNVGIGFAIPVDMVEALTRQLIEQGEVRRGQLGVLIQDLTPELAEALGLDSVRGALVTKILPDSAAQAAGLREGDVIVEVNGDAVENSAELRNRIGLMRPGVDVRLTYVRDGERHSLSIELGHRSTDTGIAGRWRHEMLPGAWFGPLTEPASDGSQIDGVRVVEVEAGSLAAQAGLREGDIIDSIDRRDIDDSASAREALDAAGDSVLLRIVRREGAFFLVISQ